MMVVVNALKPQGVDASEHVDEKRTRQPKTIGGNCKTENMSCFLDMEAKG